jgi:hypothetical protein
MPERIEAPSRQLNKRKAIAMGLAIASLAAAHPNKAGAEVHPKKPAKKAHITKQPKKIEKKAGSDWIQSTLGQLRQDLDFENRKKDTGGLDGRNWVKINSLSADILKFDHKAYKGDLKLPGSLPGAGESATQEQIHELEQSSVRIVYRTPESDRWIPTNTATKISSHGETYALTAAHFAENEYVHILTGTDPHAMDNAPAHDYIDVATAQGYEFAVTSPYDLSQPIGKVTGMSFSNNKDMALLKIEPFADGQENPWSRMPALEYDQDHARPEPGAKVVTFGASWINGFQAKAGYGVFLGSGKFQTSQGLEDVDFVGINASDPSEDKCNYGYSGATYETSTGYKGGTLTSRNNIGFPSNQPNIDGDYIETPDPDGRFAIEKIIGVNTAEFSTVCMYSQPDRSSTLKAGSMAGFVEGFNHHVSVTGKGGDPSQIKP